MRRPVTGNAPQGPLAPLADGIPAALKAQARWAPWRAEWNVKRAKFDKIPHNAHRPEFGISTARPEKWATFEDAWRAYEQGNGKFAGVGYCLTGEHGVVGVDLDNCVDNGLTAPWALEVIARLGSYTEVSPSGRGLRIFGFGAIASDWNNHEIGIEVYGGHESRFLTVTGRSVNQPGELADLLELPAAALVDLATQYARERVTADIVSIGLPELVDELALPDVATLPLPDRATRFLMHGDHAGDRSGALHAAGVALYAAGLGDAVVLSLLAGNEHAMTVALDHRRQDHDRALLYLWREHCVKARAKGLGAIASADEFAVIEAPGGDPPAAPAFKRDSKGRIEATVENVKAALERLDFCGMQVGYDEFRDDVMYAKRPGQWQAFADHHHVELRLALERKGFKPIGRELMRDVVGFVAQQHRFDSAQVWLRRLEWDGVHRIDGFLTDYFGADDAPYVRATSRYLWTALAGRVLEPGVKADMVPILVGLQGTVKSSGIAAMVPGPDFFTEISFNDKDDDQARRMRGKLLGEIGELRGLHTRELEAIKAFITRTHEHWIPKYKEFAAQYPRRIVFIGTTNKDEFLADETGNRRWLPVPVQKVDVRGVRRDREQLWAEASVRFELSGVEFQDAERLAPTVHDAHTIGEPWAERIADWLDSRDPLQGDLPRTREYLRVTDVARDALNLDMRNLGKREEMRICNALRACGFLHVRKLVKGKQARVWVLSRQPVTTSL